MHDSKRSEKQIGINILSFVSNGVRRESWKYQTSDLNMIRRTKSELHSKLK